MNKVKVLIITSGLTAGGVDTLILNTLSLMDQDKYSIDFLIFDDSKDDWKDKFTKYGGKIYKVPRARKQGLLKAIKTYKRIIIDGGYKVVHSHIGFGSILPVIACSRINHAGIITHAHYDNYEANKITQFFGRILFNVFPCRKLACSYGAGKALYGKSAKFEFIKNGIDSEKFSYNPTYREEVRRELNVDEDTFVVGTVGRMEYQKNHEFLIKIFNEINTKCKKAKLILVGDGVLRQEIQNQVNELGIEDKVVFLGIRNDVYRLLQAMDVFIMPTRFEGLSLALLEVECAGLPCLTTDVVPKEAKITDDFHFLSLNDDASVWAEQALYYKGKPRRTGIDIIIANGFDKRSAAESWFRIYDEIANL